MPSFSHEFLVELFRRSPELAPALLEQSLGIKVPGGTAEIGSIDLSQVTSPAYAADAVVRIRGEGERAAAAIVVEVQLAPDARKQWTWPVYATALRAQMECPVMLLVVAPTEDVASWARQPIELGHPGFRLVPLVVGLSLIPRVTDPDAARRLPELAVLSAVAHPDESIARVAIEALDELAEERARLYFDVIWAAIPEALRAALEEWMEKYEYQSDFAKKYLAQGLAQAVRTVAIAKTGSVPSEVEGRLRTAQDAKLLEALIGELAQAADETAARAVLARFGKEGK